MREFSIYHQGVFGACRTIRFNLAAIKRLLPEDDIKDFDLTERQRAKLQARVNLYVESGGKVDLQQGADQKPGRIVPAHIVHARPERVVRGRFYPAIPRRVVAAKWESAKPELAPSLDHLPSHSVLEKVLKKKGVKL
jgi:hypothetical protein